MPRLLIAPPTSTTGTSEQQASQWRTSGGLCLSGNVIAIRTRTLVGFHAFIEHRLHAYGPLDRRAYVCICQQYAYLRKLSSDPPGQYSISRYR